MEDWAAHLVRQEARFADGRARVPGDADARQRQLVRTANAALGAGLARLMNGEPDDARPWLLRAAAAYRESHSGAPPGSWGRMIGALKMRILADDAPGAGRDARWTLAEGAAAAASPIGRYAATLALLVLGRDAEAAPLATGLRAEGDAFPRPVADALAGLSVGDAPLYAGGLAETLRSFEARDEYLEDVPVADTVLVLERLALPRGLAVRPHSALLPAGGDEAPGTSGAAGASKRA